jgi:ATP-dependent Lhr-like helicase
LADLVGSGRVGGILVERIDGVAVLEAAQTDTAAALLAAGFARTPRGMRMR